jgi:hypothetical protein
MANPASAASKSCAICTEDILPNAIVSKLNCNHQYHRDCLKPWLDSNHNTCPLDRKRITSINGQAIELPDVEKHAHVFAVGNPLSEARIIYPIFQDLMILRDSFRDSEDSSSSEDSIGRFFSLSG